MGCCYSKKRGTSTSPPDKYNSDAQFEKETAVKKEVLVIKNPISHERESSDEVKVKPQPKKVGEATVVYNAGPGNEGGVGTPARTLSCTKEEVDAILIQCGRLSRNSSAAKSGEENVWKYSGSKRTYDFDHDSAKSESNNADEDAVSTDRESRGRDLIRQSQGRRRTPLHRSGSKERGNGGWPVSRSPGRRSQSPIPNTSTGVVNPMASNSSEPGKMVSVPATVPSNNGRADAAAKRIQAKRNPGTSSPRTRSPAARVRAGNDNQQPQLSRSNSKKADNSPFRRNPLAEIDTNVISQPPQSKKPNENKELKIPQLSITRSRQSRLSRDLDIDPEGQGTQISSYTALLLEDIQNFHQKSAAPQADLALPACLSKACSILEAVADLNSSAGSNLSTTRNPVAEKGTQNKLGNMKHEMGESILDSVIVPDVDLMEPSFHKYVTVRRGAADDLADQESSGSNSIVGSGQQWGFSSSWELSSAESTDQWTSTSKLDTRQFSKKDSAEKHNGLGRTRNGIRTNPSSTPAAAST